MNFGQAIKSGFSNYVTFSGRAARSEFWYWTLFVVLVTMAAGILDRGLFDFDESTTTGVFGPLVSLIFFLPGLAVSVRRLHDLDRSGWWLLLVFTIDRHHLADGSGTASKARPARTVSVPIRWAAVSPRGSA